LIAAALSAQYNDPAKPATDVLLGSIVSLRAAANQQRDIGHPTDVAQKGSGQWPQFRLLIHPNDFLAPQVFDPPNDAGGAPAPPERRCTRSCGRGPAAPWPW
jgi:hypothetical protein